MLRITITQRAYNVDKDGNSPLYLQVFINKRKVEMPIGVRVSKEMFNKKAQLIKDLHPYAADYNLIIQQAHGIASRIFIRYRLQEKEITVEKFREEFKNPSKYIDFYEFMDKEIRERRGTITAGTINHQLSVLEKLKKFKPDLIFAEIDTLFIERFDRFMQTKLENEINTRHASMKVFKTYLNIAKNRDLIDKNPFDKFIVKKSKTHRVALTEQELKLFIQHYESIPISNQKLVLRHFLFCCFTGLRVSDLIRLKHDNIYDGMIHITMHKTSNVNAHEVLIPLSKYAKKLIKDENRVRIKGLVFETFSEQKMRDNIKKVAEELAIEKNLGTHTARHTFATIFLKKTKDLATLQKLLGHADIKQTMVYVDVLEDDIRDGMKIFDEIIQ